jgi:outer membrane protein assembly factor BamB
LPDNTAAMTYLGYQDATAFFKELSLADNDDFEKYFVPWLGKEMAYIITEPHHDDYNAHKFAIFRIQNSQQAEEQLEAFGEKFGAFKNEQYFNYTIHRIMVNNLMKPIFGNGLNSIQNPYYVILDDYLVMGNSEVALKELLDKYTYGQTLGQDINYLQFIENLSTTSNKYVYINTANVLNILTALFKENLHNDIRQEFEYYQKLTPIGLQLTPYKNLYFLNAQIQYNKKGKQATSVIWKTDLDAEAAIPPTFVKNHSTADLEVFIQDVDNNIYLFDKNGERIWEQPITIDGRIISDIHQIDYFKNTYLQYVFNTDDKIYLIDRNGEKVQGFPIILPAKANNGIMVVDYDKTRDYRIFVACRDGNIYGFKGNELLEGWSPKANIGQIHFPLQHFTYEDKDYIVALNDVGEMFFFKRNGEERMDSVHFNTTFLSPFGYDLTAPQRIVAANNRGKAYVLNFSGKHFKLGMNTGEYENMKFEYVDVMGNERKDYVILGKNEFGIFSYNDKNEFKGYGQRTFDVTQDTLFQVQLVGSSKKHIGTFSSSTQRAYLLNGNAQIFPDFPIPATTPFQVANLYNDGKSVLIIANGHAVFAYKLKQLKSSEISSSETFAIPLQ